MGMTYSPVLPTEPGYYWIRDKDGDAVVEVWSDPGSSNSGDLFIHYCGDGCVTPLDKIPDALWAGPLEVPMLPADDIRATEEGT